MAEQLKVRLKTPKEITCPACKKTFEATEVLLTNIEAIPGNIAYFKAKTTVYCTHCNTALINRAIFKRMDLPISTN